MLMQSRYCRFTRLEVPGDDTLRRPVEKHLNRCVTFEFASQVPFSRANFHQTFKGETLCDNIYQNVLVAMYTYLKYTGKCENHRFVY